MKKFQKNHISESNNKMKGKLEARLQSV